LLYSLTDNLKLIGDLQYQGHRWELEQKLIGHAKGHNLSAPWNFVNPRFGLIYDMNDKISKTDNEWQNELSAEEYSICRIKNTEAPFTGIYWDCKDKGTYKCTCCGLELFSSESKFDSGTGWPSFSQALNNDSIEFVKDAVTVC